MDREPHQRTGHRRAPAGMRPGTRAWLTLGAWAAVVAALALLGAGIAGHLTPSTLLVPGTPSARAQKTIDREFGNSVTVTVLLRGPAAAIDRQGPRLVAALRREGRVRTMSPWVAGAPPTSLRPRPGAALVVAGFQRPDTAALTEVVPDAQRAVDTTVHSPVRADVGGMAAVGLALQRDALDATHQAELLVAPVLILVLLLVFRSPIAAAIPLLMGASTVLAGRGLLTICAGAMPINALAVSVASMMGLALGVDYALLMVSRFRQERDGGAGTDAALAIASRAAGRTIVFAGGTLALAMLTANLIAPGDLLGSVAAGVMVSALLSVLLAISVLPALIRVAAPHLERWRLPSFGRGGRLLDLAAGLVARPWISIPLIVGAMLAIAAPAGALSIGPPDPRQLPPSDPTRQGFEALRREIGPGWSAPIAVVATARDGVISDPGRLAAISRWQKRVARDPAVEAVIGPASFGEAEGALAGARRGYRTAPERLARAQRGIASLRSGLHEADDGVAQLRAGLGSAADGAGTIASRTREAEAGAKQLERGLGRASAGAGRLSAGLERALRGAERVLAGQHRLSGGALRLARGARRLDRLLQASLGEVRAVGERLRAWSAWVRALRTPTELAGQRLEQALQELEAMTVGQEDPRYERLLEAIREAAALIGLPEGAVPAEGVPLPAGVAASLTAQIVGVQERIAGSLDSLAEMPDQIERLAEGVDQLSAGADAVAAGARRSERGGRELHGAVRRLTRGGRRLDRGLEDASGGGARLADGLGAIAAGAETLAGGLGEGEERSGDLAAGLGGAQKPLGNYATVLSGYRSALGSLRSETPGAIDSGYLMLTALDGTVPAVREQIDQMVNLDSGGEAVRMLVVPASGPNSAQTGHLERRLRDELPALARASGTRVAIGEGAQVLADYTSATMARLPLLIGALCLVSVLMLVMVLRSLALPLVAVGLNLLTIAAAFGALQLFFGLDLLVGPHFVDAISAAGVLTIMFVLSVDYEVFLLTRMREAWLASGDHLHAIEHGLRSTAGVITGAAAIMSSVFLAFATAQIASLQQFGAGLTFAILIDATVIRLVLLPAVMRALGPRAWWLPRWLDRVLPDLDIEGGGAEPAPQLGAAPAAK
jgi:RND superfamily putative drug exporter